MMRSFHSLTSLGSWIVAWLLLGTAVFCVAQTPAPALETKALEKKIHELVNGRRTDHHGDALEWDDRLAAIAREHSRDMAEHDFFDHTNLKDEGPAERVQNHGLRPGKEYESVGENIFEVSVIHSTWTTLSSTGKETIEVHYRTPESIASETVQGWMASSGHRRNILNSGFQHQGIGVAVSAKGEVYITELFLGIPGD